MLKVINDTIILQSFYRHWIVPYLGIEAGVASLHLDGAGD
jgi:hypothetical protein